MKLLTETQLLTLIDPSDNEIATALGQLRKVESDHEAATMDELVRRGVFSTVTVAYRDKPLYTAFYQKNAAGDCYIAGIGALTAEDNFEVLELAWQEMMRRMGAKKICVHTRRLGLIEKLRKRGWRTAKILLEFP
jgi:hypothetical protein